MAAALPLRLLPLAVFLGACAEEGVPLDGGSDRSGGDAAVHYDAGIPKDAGIRAVIEPREESGTSGGPLDGELTVFTRTRRFESDVLVPTVAAGVEVIVRFADRAARCHR